MFQESIEKMLESFQEALERWTEPLSLDETKIADTLKKDTVFQEALRHLSLTDLAQVASLHSTPPKDEVCHEQVTINEEPTQEVKTEEEAEEVDEKLNEKNTTCLLRFFEETDLSGTVVTSVPDSGVTSIENQEEKNDEKEEIILAEELSHLAL